MADVFVPVTRAQQETDWFCGPATAQMVLSALGVAKPPTPPTWQRQLWDYVVKNTGSSRPTSAPADGSEFDGQKCDWCSGQWECWTTTPGVLVSLLNSSQGLGQYSITKHSSEEMATGVLLDTIDRGLPGIVLVYGDRHWLVVDGYKHNVRNSVPVAGRNLKGVFIRNPEKYQAGHYVTWTKWESHYLTVITCGDYKNKYLVLSGTKAAVPVLGPTPYAQPLIAATPPVTSDPWTMPMKTLIAPHDAIRKASEQVDELDGERLRFALRESSPRTAQLVQRLDDPDAYYYIVSFYASARETTRMIVNGFDGSLEEASFIEERGEGLEQYHSAGVARDRLRAAFGGAPDALRFRVREGTIGEHPVLVWKPCVQSKSPFLPFYQFSVGDSFVYYRVDGEWFDALTTRRA